MKKAIFLLIAHMCTAPALQELRAIFTHFDVLNRSGCRIRSVAGAAFRRCRIRPNDCRGALSLSHFREVLFQAGMAALQVEQITHALDQDASGMVTWTEFIAAALCVSVCRNRRLVEAAFAVFDKDMDGKARPQKVHLFV
eukprot:g28256.t1